MDNAPVYYVDEAVEFIFERSGINKNVINKVLELEADYLRSLGLIVDLNNEEFTEE